MWAKHCGTACGTEFTIIFPSLLKSLARNHTSHCNVCLQGFALCSKVSQHALLYAPRSKLSKFSYLFRMSRFGNCMWQGANVTVMSVERLANSFSGTAALGSLVYAKSIRCPQLALLLAVLHEVLSSENWIGHIDEVVYAVRKRSQNNKNCRTNLQAMGEFIFSVFNQLSNAGFRAL